MFKSFARILPNLLILFLLLLPSSSYNLLKAQSKKANNGFRMMTYNIRYAGDEKIDGIKLLE